MWRNAIKKEFKDMFEHKVWEKVKKTEIPSDRRILGNKWVLKKKRSIQSEVSSIGISSDTRN